MIYDPAKIFTQLEEDSKCENCLYRNECDNYKEEHKNWWCGNWMRDPKATEQLQFDFEESEG